jgi:hypothetical protein
MRSGGDHDSPSKSVNKAVETGGGQNESSERAGVQVRGFGGGRGGWDTRFGGPRPWLAVVFDVETGFDSQ